MSDVLAWLGVVGGVAGGAAALYTAIRARSIEHYRAQLKAEGYEHEIRFARLHERRVDVVADLYRKLVRAERAFGSWVDLLQQAGEPTIVEKGALAAEAFNEFRTFFLESRIWLEQDLCDRIAEVDRELFTAFIDFTTYRKDDPRVHDEHMATWLATWRKMREDIPRLRQAIESRFREMLGVGRTAMKSADVARPRN